MPDDDLLSEQERKLFRETVANTKPLPKQNKQSFTSIPKAAKTPAPRQTVMPSRSGSGFDRYAVGSISTESTLAATSAEALTQNDAPKQYCAPGVGQDVFRNLRRGQWRIGHTLDLHGARLDAAQAQVHTCLAHAQAHGVRCVCMVHGQGFGSAGGIGVLKQHVRHWLSHDKRVRAFIEAPPQYGGAGAVLVLVAKSH